MAAPDKEIMMGLIIFYIIFFGIFFIFGLTSYLLKGFGMYGIAKRLNIPNGWLAFIPVASNYLQGRLAGESIKVGKKEFKNPGLWLLIAPIIFYVIFFTVYFVFIFSFVIQAISMENAMYDEFAMLNMLGSMISFIIAFVIIGLIGGTLVNLLYGMVRYNIHKIYQDDNKAVLHMLLGMFIPLYQSIYFFVLRNKTPLFMEAVTAETAQQILPPTE